MLDSPAVKESRKQVTVPGVLLHSLIHMLALRTATRYARRTRSVGQLRLFSNKHNYDAVVLDAYSDNGRLALSQSSHISNATRSSILEQLQHSNFKTAGDVRVLYNVGGVKQVAVVNLGELKQLTQGDNVAGKRLEAARTAVCIDNMRALYISIINFECPILSGCNWSKSSY